MEGTAGDCNIVMNSQPPNKLVEVSISFVVIDLLDGCDNRMNKNTRTSNKSRSRASDRVIFVENLAPSIHTCTRDTQAFRDQFQVPTKVPET